MTYDATGLEKPQKAERISTKSAFPHHKKPRKVRNHLRRKGFVHGDPPKRALSVRQQIEKAEREIKRLQKKLDLLDE